MSSVSIETTPTPTWYKVKSMLCEVKSSSSTTKRRLNSFSSSTSSSSSEYQTESDTSFEAKKSKNEKEKCGQETQTMVSIPCNTIVKTPTYEDFLKSKTEVSNNEVSEGSFIPGTDYFIGKLLGQGGYGRVYSATKYNKEYAIKVNKHSTKSNIENNLHERETLKRIATSNFTDYLVKCSGIVQFGQNYCFVMEKLDISLQDILTKSRKPFQLRTVIHLTEQICNASTALLNIGYLHLDIKPANILFCNVNDEKDSWKIKLCDFGLAVPKENIRKYSGPAQTISYRAPEVLLGLPKCDRVDCWSIGCVVFYVYTEVELFTARNELETIRQIQHVFGLPRGFEKGHHVAYYFEKKENCELVLRPASDVVPMYFNQKYLNDLEKFGYNFTTKGRSKDLDAAVVTLIESLLQINPAERCTAKDAIEFLSMMKEICPDDLI